MTITKFMNDSKHVEVTLRALSLWHKGAWVYNVLPFSHETHFIQFASPAKVPDSYFDISHNQIGYKGKIVPFSKSAQYREQQRGYSGDR